VAIQEALFASGRFLTRLVQNDHAAPSPPERFWRRVMTIMRSASS
jgi:hypothetical protein